ncbi:MAG: PspC domain-containing protein [Hellea sp.]|nr:PspC domain-containing protein [Hellea sp.]
MTRRYKNPVHRSLHDANWDGSDDGYEYSGPHRLRRNKIDGVLGGVCAGLGDYLGMDPVIVRVIFVLLLIFTGLPIIIYPILWLCIPSDKRAPYRREYRESRRARHKARRRYREDSEPVKPIRTATFRDTKSKFRSLEERMQDLERSVTSKEWRLRREFRDLES